MSVTAGIFYDVSAHLCPAPVTDHKVEGGGVLGVDDGAVEADGAPTWVGHLSSQGWRRASLPVASSAQLLR